MDIFVLAHWIAMAEDPYPIVSHSQESMRTRAIIRIDRTVVKEGFSYASSLNGRREFRAGPNNTREG